MRGVGWVCHTKKHKIGRRQRNKWKGKDLQRKKGWSWNAKGDYRKKKIKAKVGKPGPLLPATLLKGSEYPKSGHKKKRSEGCIRRGKEGNSQREKVENKKKQDVITSIL